MGNAVSSFKIIIALYRPIIQYKIKDCVYCEDYFLIKSMKRLSIVRIINDLHELFSFFKITPLGMDRIKEAETFLFLSLFFGSLILNYSLNLSVGYWILVEWTGGLKKNS